MSQMPEYAMTYLVYWPDVFGEGRGVLKVGRAWRFHRVQMMTRTGGHIIVLARGTNGTWEREALKELRHWFPQAFANEREAESLLYLGRGWSECFEVDEYHLQLAVDLCFKGFARGDDQGVNAQATDDQRERSAVPGVRGGAARSEVDGDDAVADNGRERAPGGVAEPDRGGCVSGRGGDGPRRDAFADAGRVRVSEPVPGGGVDVASTREAAEIGPSRRCRGLSAASTRSSMEVHGCGGSGRAGAGADDAGERRAGAGVGRVGSRAGAWGTAATARAAGCPADRLPRASQRKVQGLRALRDRASPPRQVGGAGQVRRSGRGVREGAVG